MKTILSLAITSFLGLALCAPSYGSFIVSDWSLGSGVHDFHGDQSQTHTFTQVISPFVNNHSVAIPPSTATANYNFEFDDFTASFHTGAAHQALDVPLPGLASGSGGVIILQTAQDLLVSVTGSYNYALPPDLFTADLEANITRSNPYQLFWGDDPSANSFGGNFVSGTLHVGTPAAGVLLPAGGTYVLDYRMRVNTFGGGTNAIGTGNGEIQWNIQVVPEPAFIAWPTLAIALVRRRRKFA